MNKINKPMIYIVVRKTEEKLTKDSLFNLLFIIILIFFAIKHSVKGYKIYSRVSC